MSKYTIATFIVGWATGFICYLIGYMVGITHDKRTIAHECVKDTHDKDEPQTDRQRLEGKRWTDALTTEEMKCILDALDIADAPQTDCPRR